MVQDCVQREMVVAHGAMYLVEDRRFFTTEWLSTILEDPWSMDLIM